jgi:hypothetical protein
MEDVKAVLAGLAIEFVNRPFEVERVVADFPDVRAHPVTELEQGRFQAARLCGLTDYALAREATQDALELRTDIVEHAQARREGLNRYLAEPKAMPIERSIGLKNPP